MKDANPRVRTFKN